MIDTSTIHALIARARRRLRLQAALESATITSIIAFAAGLGVVYAARRHAIDDSTAVALLIACVGLVLVGGVLGALGRFPTHIVATRIDRASNLSDRLSSACAFEQQLADDNPHHDAEMQAFMQAAIRDAIKAAPGADVRAATPFRKPRELRAASAFAVVALLVAGLYWPENLDANPVIPVIDDPTALVPGLAKDRPDEFVEEDLEYTRDLLNDLKQTSKVEKEPNLDRFVDKVEELREKAEMGELSKKH